MTRKADDKKPDLPYQVGYCKPPSSTQFKKGQSGNPRGRPTGKSNLATSLTRALNEKVTVVENGERRRISKLDAAVKQVINKAAAGDARAFQQMVNLSCLVAADDGHAIPNALNKEADREVMAQLLERFHLEGSTSSERGTDTDQVTGTPTSAPALKRKPS